MGLTIKNERVSGKPWGEVDKTALRNRLVKALEDNEDGAREAVREVYAVITSEDIKDAQNWWGPHHEITQEGTVILNRGGMIAAAAALAGARAEPDLTGAQIRATAAHLLKHYRQEEVNLQPPASLLRLAGASAEIVAVSAHVSGEMRVEDVPVNTAINLSALKEGDDSPLEVIVEIPAGKSKRGWNYKPSAIQRIVDVVMKEGLPGFLGHQKPDNVDHEFPNPVTHWVGAKFQDGRAYFRGVIDKASSDLKRWIRSGAIKTVSIFGIPTLRNEAGETQVVDYQPLSIDWTPLGRAGMPTRVVAVGEMDVDIIEKKESEKMTIQELLDELRKLGAKPAQVMGEMGWKMEDIEGVEGVSEIKAKAEAFGEIAQIFGGKGTEEVVSAVRGAHAAMQKAKQDEHEKLVIKVIGEMVQAEAVRPLVRRMLTVDVEADEAGIRKAVGELLQQDDVKKVLAEVFKDTIISPKAPRDEKTALRVKRVAI